LSLAVATSAAFPVVLGPATVEASNHCSGAPTVWWHLADGGLIENLGIETLEETALRAISAPQQPDRVLLITIDGEARPDAEASFADEDLSIWTSDPARIVDVAMARGRAYHDQVWSQVFENEATPVTELSVRYTDAVLDGWPASCGDAKGEIAARLAGVATALRISDCDADLLEAAAHQLVHAAINARLDALAAQGFSVRRVAPHENVDEGSR
jgi:hypothetical protein